MAVGTFCNKRQVFWDVTPCQRVNTAITQVLTKISLRKFRFKLIYRNVIEVSFQTELLYFTEETSFRLFCNGKTLYFNLFDPMNDVYSTPFHTFHLQLIWLTIRYSKRILFVTQAVPAANWYSDVLKRLHCQGQAFSNYFPVATAKHSRRLETAATSVWEIKELRLL